MKRLLIKDGGIGFDKARTVKKVERFNFHSGFTRVPDGKGKIYMFPTVILEVRDIEFRRFASKSLTIEEALILADSLHELADKALEDFENEHKPKTKEGEDAKAGRIIFDLPPDNFANRY